MCHQACLDPHHFNIISPNPPESELVIMTVYKHREKAWEIQIFPHVLKVSTSDDKSPVPLILFIHVCFKPGQPCASSATL